MRSNLLAESYHSKLSWEDPWIKLKDGRVLNSNNDTHIQLLQKAIARGYTFDDIEEIGGGDYPDYWMKSVQQQNHPEANKYVKQRVYDENPYVSHSLRTRKLAEEDETFLKGSWVYDDTDGRIYRGWDHINIIPEIPGGWQKAGQGHLICGWWVGKDEVTIATDTVSQDLADKESLIAEKAKAAAIADYQNRPRLGPGER